MTVFGKSLFATVLESLDLQVEEDEEDTASSSVVRGFNGGYVGGGFGARADAGSDPSLLFDGYPPDPVQAVPVIPNWLGRLSETEIAEDLALQNCRSENDLRERRRLFAFENHPDRFSVEYRDQATRRMMVANQFLDAALVKFR